MLWDGGSPWLPRDAVMGWAGQFRTDLSGMVADPAKAIHDHTPMASQDPALLRRLLRAKDRMDAASEEEWPVERLASVSGVSEAHFSRSFKEAFGVPPHRYLLTRRIERAKALLRDTEMSIVEIAFQTGWNSLGTFGRVFRDVTGVSPSEHRIHEQANAHCIGQVPHCFVSAAYRPNLKIAVSEKRRQEIGDRTDPEETEVPND